MPRKQKTATDIKIDTIAREIKELKEEVKQLNKTVSFGRGAAFVFLFLGSIAAGVYNLFTR
jgi:hypothetical protein